MHTVAWLVASLATELLVLLLVLRRSFSRDFVERMAVLHGLRPRRTSSPQELRDLIDQYRPLHVPLRTALREQLAILEAERTAAEDAARAERKEAERR